MAKRLHWGGEAEDQPYHRKVAKDAIVRAVSGVNIHGQAPRHLETAGAEGKDAARHLRRLLPLKTRAQYDPVRVSAAAARAAVTAAERLVAISKAVVGQLGE